MSDRRGRIQGDHALDREADAWVMLIASRAATHDDAQALREWRARSAAHDAAYRDAARLRRSILVVAQDLRTQEAAEPAIARDGGVAARRPRPGRRQVLTGTIAASLAGVGVLAGGRLAGLWSDDTAEFVTRKGERRLVRLGDGVSVELNTATRMSRRPDLGARAIELFEGEMLLTASPAGGEPVLVLAAGGRTVAHGARVALRCDRDTVSVTCLAGTATVQMGATERGILPGQQLRYDDGGLGEPTGINPALVTAWRSGVLIFRRTRVGDVIAEIGRYHDGRIVIANPALADRRIDGTFHVAHIDQIFDQLRSVYGTDVTHLPGGIIVLT